MAPSEANMRVYKAGSRGLAEDWEEWMDWNPDKKQTVKTDGSTSPEEWPAQARVPSSTSSLSPQSQKKRKLSADGSEATAQTKTSATEERSVQDKSHSLVEKRYRENLNQKIADLKECIPSLRTREDGSQDRGGTMQRQNKATILTEAMGYIHQLEKRNTYLEEANDAMKEQMQRNERERLCEAMPSGEGNLESQDDPMEETSPAASEETAVHNEPRGIIPVPEEMRRLWRGQSQEHYADRICRDSDERSAGAVHIKGGKYIGRMVVGSLAGFMVLDGFATPRTTIQKREDRGLSAMPMPYLLPTSRRILANHQLLPSSFLVSHFSRAFLLFGVLGLMLFLYLYYSKPPPRKSKPTSTPQAAPSLASPLEVRQNAWLTSIQTVWVPQHNMLPEMLALILETAAYLTRQLLGWRCYSWITGRTEDEEVARVRSWDIALDAQLSGGDAEVSKSRLVLTLWAAGTLPSTPSRLMLKALHIRILFWRPSRFDIVCRLLHKAAIHLARHQWTNASKMQNREGKTPNPVGLGNDEPLADHLQALLHQSADEVLNDEVIQRMHNLVWNRSSDDSSQDGNNGLDNVIDDSAMRGPLDALASWFSRSKLQAGLRLPFKDVDESSEIGLALETAPPGSSTRLRALAAKAVFTNKERRSECCTELALSLKDVKSPLTATPIAVDHAPADAETLVAWSCAMALSEVHGGVIAGTAARRLASVLSLRSDRDGLLSLTAVHCTLHAIFTGSSARENNLSFLTEEMEGLLKRLEAAETADNVVEAGARKSLCVELRRLLDLPESARRTSDASLDAGYGTMSDEEVLGEEAI